MCWTEGHLNEHHDNNNYILIPADTIVVDKDSIVNQMPATAGREPEILYFYKYCKSIKC